MEFFTSSLSDPADSQVEGHGNLTECYGLRILGLKENRFSLRILPTMPSLLNTAAIDFLKKFRLPAKKSLQHCPLPLKAPSNNARLPAKDSLQQCPLPTEDSLQQWRLPDEDSLKHYQLPDKTPSVDFQSFIWSIPPPAILVRLLKADCLSMQTPLKGNG
jgi:hypothetical protein